MGKLRKAIEELHNCSIDEIMAGLAKAGYVDDEEPVEDTRIEDYFDRIDAMSDDEFEKWAVETFKLRKIWKRVPKCWEKGFAKIILKGKPMDILGRDEPLYEGAHENNGIYKFMIQGKYITQYDKRYDLLEVVFDKCPDEFVDDSDDGGGLWTHWTDITHRLVGFTIWDFMSRDPDDIINSRYPMNYFTLRHIVEMVLEEVG